MRRILPLLKCWTLWYALVLLGLPLVLLASEPATQPADKEKQEQEHRERETRLQFDGNAIGDAVIQLPDGRTMNLADLQGDGVGIVMVRSDVGDGAKNLVVTENDRTFTINETEDEIVVTIKEGDEEPTEYRAANAEELEQNHPEAYEVYELYADRLHAMPPVAAAMAGGMGGQFRFAFRNGAGGPQFAHGFGGMEVESIGISCRPVFDEFVRAQLGEGVIVADVHDDSLAQQMGLEQHDLIQKVNGQEVRTAEDLQDLIDNAGGEPLKFEVVRAGKPLTVEEK